MTIIEQVHRPENSGYGRSKFWLCQCYCGNTVVRSSSYFRSVEKPSCGCDVNSNRVTHGMTNTRLFKVWQKMIDRCINPNNPSYHNYGGRGITVCESWENSFTQFFNDMGNSPERYELDRIDNNQGYCKENCHWVSKKENLRNKRNNRIVKYKEQDYVLTELAELLQMSASTLSYRLDNDIPLDKPIGRWK